MGKTLQDIVIHVKVDITGLIRESNWEVLVFLLLLAPRPDGFRLGFAKRLKPTK
jgi:hypothetical protein